MDDVLRIPEIRSLWDWINERHAVFLRKAALEDSIVPDWAQPGGPPMLRKCWSLDHLTHDTVMQEYRFCNVFRELDRVTIWIRENIREKYERHPYLWYMLMIARELNWPPALQRLIEANAWPTVGGFRPHHITEVLADMSIEGTKWHTGAYMIQAPNKRWFGDISKMEYVGEMVLGKPWRDR